MENINKQKKNRETNWSTNEKELLRECINSHLSIVEFKGNDTSIIQKKKNAWNDIQKTMASAGYDRDIAKLKSQWVRMKVSARKAAASVKKASIKTGNCVKIPEVNEEDELVQSMIANEFEEDKILIDSDTNFLNSSMILENSSSNIDTTSVKQELISSGIEQANTGNDSFNVRIDNKRKASSPTKLQRLKKLPKTPSKSNIILERQQQIAKESLQSDEINTLLQKQLNENIEHEQQKQTLELQQAKEIHRLKIKQLQQQIENDKELHNLKLKLVQKKLTFLEEGPFEI